MVYILFLTRFVLNSLLIIIGIIVISRTKEKINSTDVDKNFFYRYSEVILGIIIGVYPYITTQLYCEFYSKNLTRFALFLTIIPVYILIVMLNVLIVDFILSKLDSKKVLVTFIITMSIFFIVIVEFAMDFPIIIYN